MLSTPNLGSWVNRLFFLLGYQPYNVEVSTEILAGVLIKHTKPSGHIRSFTLRALKELLSFHGFRVVKVLGTWDIHPRRAILMFLDRLFRRERRLQEG